MTEEIQQTLRDVGLADWLHDWDVKNIYDEVSKLKFGQTYLEIGVAHGASLAVANLAAKFGVSIFGIDVINWADREEKIKEFLSAFGKEKTHEFIEGDSQLYGTFWDHGYLDLLFIDGDHTYEGVLKDIASWFPWLNSSAVVMFDDYNEKTGVKKAIDEVLKDHKAFKEHKIDNEMYICRL